MITFCGACGQRRTGSGGGGGVSRMHQPRRVGCGTMRARGLGTAFLGAEAPGKRHVRWHTRRELRGCMLHPGSAAHAACAALCPSRFVQPRPLPPAPLALNPASASHLKVAPPVGHQVVHLQPAGQPLPIDAQVQVHKRAGARGVQALLPEVGGSCTCVWCGVVWCWLKGWGWGWGMVGGSWAVEGG